MIDDETLAAYLDGELEAEASDRVEQALSADPALALRLEQQMLLKTRLGAAFDPILAEPVPASILAAAAPAAEVVDIRAARTRRPAPLQDWWAKAGAVAAALVAGLVGGLTLSGGSGAAFAVKDDAVVIEGPLGRGLERQLASAGGDVRIQLSFRDTEGRFCRTFAWASSEGLACKEGDGWRLRALFGRDDASKGSAYRMAAGQNPALMALAQEMMAGEPLTATQEKRAREAEWLGRTRR